MPDHPTEDAARADASEEAQAPIVAYLASLATEPPITTHLSRVFLLPGRVLKLKRARTLPFVDYAPLAAREAYCRQEIDVNRRFAPALYTAARPVHFDGASYAIEGAGEIVDWVVDMKRFDTRSQFDMMVEAGTLDGDLIDALALRIAAMHREAEIVRVRDQVDRVTALCTQLRDDIAPHLSDPADRAALDAWDAKARDTLAREAARLDRRARHGFVRRCHADLHLSNICLWEGAPTLFDAIEFDEDLATIDVLYDVAFALIDLSFRGRADLSSRLLSRYLEATRDYAGLAVLPLFLSNRHMVRALVGVMKGRDPAPYLAAAGAVLAAGHRPRLIAIGGRSGTGKSTVARGLAPLIGAVVIRSDAIRKHLAGTAPHEKLPESAYTAEARAAIYRRMLVDARRAVRAGWPVILDATFLGEAARDAVGAAAAAWGVPFEGLWLEAATDLLASRVTARANDVSDADARVVAAQATVETGAMRWTVVPAGGSPEAVVAAAKAALDR
ncbi:AAA family ATPase [Acuticoccus kandeliae]|uniref:bifunctional aminoglycoside phosphotransferase/ATP-binding protein n=1 Tax=Acuticoccus kandeliae TaxID=2073160 RepID=UPI000D3E8C99|nr:bifunctional aminoglycoside phosphotransferase/ATP-binding protein [Acuticoccus kandeliae]